MITLHGDHGSIYSEIIMNQTASHSQTPNFAKVESQTSARLYQHPTVEEQKSTTRWIGNFFMTIVLLIAFTSMTVIGLKSCANEADFQAQKYRELNAKRIDR